MLSFPIPTKSSFLKYGARGLYAPLSPIQLDIVDKNTVIFVEFTLDSYSSHSKQDLIFLNFSKGINFYQLNLLNPHLYHEKDNIYPFIFNSQTMNEFLGKIHVTYEERTKEYSFEYLFFKE